MDVYHDTCRLIIFLDRRCGSLRLLCGNSATLAVGRGLLVLQQLTFVVSGGCLDRVDLRVFLADLFLFFDPQFGSPELRWLVRWWR